MDRDHCQQTYKYESYDQTSKLVSQRGIEESKKRDCGKSVSPSPKRLAGSDTQNISKPFTVLDRE